MGVKTAIAPGKIKGNSCVAAYDAFVIGANCSLKSEEVAFGVDVFRRARSQGRDVEEPADAACAIDRRRRSLDDFNAFRRAQWRRERAGVFNALEAAKIGVGAVAAK